MRIWAFPYVYPFPAPGRTWFGIFAHRQYKGLIERGADLKVINPVHWVPPQPFSGLMARWRAYSIISYPRERIYDGVQVYHPRISNFLPYAIEKKDYRQRFRDAVARFFKEQKIKLHPSTDIFYSQWMPESWIVQEVAHEFGIKSAILAIGDDVVVWPRESEVNFQAFQQLYKKADFRFVCSDYLGREANKILGEELDYDVVNWGVDYDYFKPPVAGEMAKLRAQYNLPADKTLILNVGSAIVRKGWLDLFDAMQSVVAEHQNVAIVALYGGHKVLDLQQEAKNRNLQDYLIDLGEIAPEKVGDIFKAVDIFCLPSHWEGLANANIEAMSCGLPVITTNVSGHPELITDNFNGMLIPPKEPAILAEKLLKVIEDQEFRNMLKKNGRTFIVNKWGNYFDNTELLYKKLTMQ